MKIKINKGFTLAEVLITLGVIGVVAVMTLPSVINKYKEQETVNKLKKFYSTISNAYLLSVKDNGYANEWNIGYNYNTNTARQVATYLKPYLKIVRDCNVNPGCLGYTENINRLDKNKYHTNYDTSNLYYKTILSDGSYIWWRSTTPYCNATDMGVSNICISVWTDINGGKEPNTIGKDIFLIFITPNGVKSTMPEYCTKNSEGWGCAGYILKNGNMNYLHE